MLSVFTYKYQTTIPKTVKEKLKLSVNDSIQWKVKAGRAFLSPAQKNFLSYQNRVKTDRGDIAKDIERARKLRVEKFH